MKGAAFAGLAGLAGTPADADPPDDAGRPDDAGPPDHAGPDIRVLDPRGERPDIQWTPLTPRPDTLDDTTIYLISMRVAPSHFEAAFSDLEAALHDQYSNVTIERYDGAPRDTAEEADAFVYGAAPSGGGTWAVSSSVAELEKEGVPGVALIYETLEEVAESTSDEIGVDFRWVSGSQPVEGWSEDEMDRVVSELITALTAERTGDELRDDVVERPEPHQVAVEGTYDEVQEHFHAQGWSAGKPIVPPTEEKVEEMLTGTSHSRDTVISEEFGVHGWGVTVESVAINAVMAGAKPEYLPVHLASAQAAAEITENGQTFGTWSRSSNEFSFPQMVNGPIRDEIDFNSGAQALAPGDRANAALGWGVQLFMRAMGGAKDGIHMQSVMGAPSNYGLAFAENEELSPWEPFHVTQGYDADDSVLTMFTAWNSHGGKWGFTNSTERWAQQMAHSEYPKGWMALLSPDQARVFQEDGMSKNDVRNHLYHQASRPIGELRGMQMWDEWGFARDAHPNSDELVDLPDDEVVPVYPEKRIHPIVVGSPTNPGVQGWSVLTHHTVSIDDWR